MGDRAAEQLSALMDNELDDAELQLLLRRIRDDAEYGERWQRFHLASEAMRNGLPDRIDINLATRVRGVIDSDPATTGPVVTTPIGQKRHLRPMIGFAMAASLAAVVALGLKLMGEEPGQSFPVATELEVPRASAEPQIDDSSVARLFVPAHSNMDAKMYPYLLNHNEQVSRSVAPKVLPLGRMVGYEINR
jgi:negative regulator of sigma E activity